MIYIQWPAGVNEHVWQGQDIHWVISKSAVYFAWECAIHICQGIQVEIPGQLWRIGSLFPPYEYQVLNSGLVASIPNH